MEKAKVESLWFSPFLSFSRFIAVSSLVVFIYVSRSSVGDFFSKSNCAMLVIFRNNQAMQRCALMPCTRCASDFIQACGMILCRDRSRIPYTAFAVISCVERRLTAQLWLALPSLRLSEAKTYHSRSAYHSRRVCHARNASISRLQGNHAAEHLLYFMQKGAVYAVSHKDINCV